MDGQKTNDKIHRILFYEAREAFDVLRNTEVKDPLLSSELSWSNLRLLLITLLRDKPNLILFLGAGTSMSVTVTPADNNSVTVPFQPLTWDKLLEGLFDGLDNFQKDKFLKDLNESRGGKIVGKDQRDRKNFFNKIKGLDDKPTLAWHLRLYFDEAKPEEPVNRNIRIYELVSEPLESSNFESPLLEQIVKLPFNDIITTNFDHSIEKFLKVESEFREKNRGEIKKHRGYDTGKFKVSNIFDPSRFLRAIAERSKHRLFYIHGKAVKDGTGLLVLDKFDFAKLIAQKDSILEYLIGQILNSTIIYFGFGLDDQTFNYVQERLRKIFRKHESYYPPSFSFSTSLSETEIDAFRKIHINIISYKGHEKLPKILENVNLILEYLRQFPEREINSKFLSADLNLTSQYQERGREKYVQEEYEESLNYYRLAMASLLFYEDADMSDSNFSPEKSWDYIKRLVDIRRHLVLNLSKLRWKEPDSYQNRTELLEGTIERARKLLVECEAKDKINRFSNKIKLGIKAQKASIEVLKARIKAHEGNIQESYEIYDVFEDNFKKDSDTRSYLDVYEKLLKDLEKKPYQELYELNKLKYKDKTDEIENSNETDDQKASKKKRLDENNYKYQINEDTLLLGYSYIFAREQRKRHKSFLEHESYTKDEELQYRDNYRSLINQLTNEKNKQYLKSEYSTSLQTLADVLIIALWEIGSRFIRYSSVDILPNDDPDFDFYIDEAIRLFSEDKEKFSEHENKITVDDGSKISILPSKRWQAKMYRHKCRAYMLKWVKNQERKIIDEENLLSAFTSFKNSLDTSEKANLKGEFLKACLESVRMNSLVILYTSTKHPSYALSESAGYYYLSQATEAIHDLLHTQSKDLKLKQLQEECYKPENSHVWWLLIFVLKMATYFKAILGKQKDIPSKSDIFLKKALREFLEKDTNVMKEIIIQEYKRYCLEVMKNEKELDNVIEKFEMDLEKIVEQSEKP